MKTTIKITTFRDGLGQWCASNGSELVASGNTRVTMTQNLGDYLYHAGFETAEIDGEACDVEEAYLSQMRQLWSDFKASELPPRRSAK